MEESDFRRIDDSPKLQSKLVIVIFICFGKVAKNFYCLVIALLILFN